MGAAAAQRAPRRRTQNGRPSPMPFVRVSTTRSKVALIFIIHYCPCLLGP